MPLKGKLKIKTTVLLLLVTMCQGCGDASTTVAREAANRQAQQNTAMAELQREVATGTHKLVAADAQARKEIVTVHHDLQQERSRLDAGWTELNGERQQIAGDRRTESMLSSVATIVGSVLLVVLLMGFCRHILSAAQQDSASVAELQELLVNEVLSDSASPPPLSALKPRTHSDLPAASQPLLESASVLTHGPTPT